MRADSNVHLPEDELLSALYGLGDGELHLASCAVCQSKLAEMQARRAQVEQLAADSEVSPEALMQQRRSIYARLSEPVRWWQQTRMLQWASLGTAAIALGTGLIVMEDRPAQHRPETVSDAQLAQEVSQLSLEAESHPTAPLKGLFE